MDLINVHLRAPIKERSYNTNLQETEEKETLKVQETSEKNQNIDMITLLLEKITGYTVLNEVFIQSQRWV